VSQIVDATRNETLHYTYDELDRLLNVTGAYHRSYAYDRIGNLTGKDTAANPGTTGLAAWWSLDETSGTRQDSYGTNDLTDNNTVGYGQGVQGNAASVAPANLERLSIPDNASISTGNIDFTLVAHVYLNNTTGTFTIVDKSNNTNTTDYRLGHNAGTGFRFRVGSGSAYVDSGAVTANTWHSVIAWHDAAHDTLNIQVDNGTVNTVPFATGTTDSTNPVSIGAYPNGTYGLDGRVDEVSLYKRVLTADERAWLYNNGTGRKYADLTALDPATATTYSYADTDHAHAVKDLSSGEHYEYDANGNMTLRVEDDITYTQSFNAENRLIAVTVGGATTHFIFDGDGNLIKQIKPDGSRTLYVGGVYEVNKNSGGAVTGTKTYYPAAGAMRDGSTLYYMLKDHLGSASALTDASGNTVAGAETRYYPFGEARFTGPMVTDKLFTGQRQIAELGIYHYGARFYSPKLGRFLSADTIVPGYANPQNLNRFSYVTNNPCHFFLPVCLTAHSMSAC
jgi:RHS repeat-associated protein